MRLKISDARARLGEVVLHVQNPNECAVLTRHGVPVAAVVSMENVKRIWQVEDEEIGEMRHPLFNMAHKRGSSYRAGHQIGLNGKVVTKREAALQVRSVQWSRAEERRFLAEGGLDPVEGGELDVGACVVEVPAPQQSKRRKWYKFWSRT